jgi:hypothetical protein
MGATESYGSKLIAARYDHLVLDPLSVTVAPGSDPHSSSFTFSRSTPSNCAYRT